MKKAENAYWEISFLSRFFEQDMGRKSIPGIA
jgi:hypothetical protein